MTLGPHSIAVGHAPSHLMGLRDISQLGELAIKHMAMDITILKSVFF